jgi:uncharacterized repeat protein (TIGR04138 family)
LELGREKVLSFVGAGAEKAITSAPFNPRVDVVLDTAWEEARQSGFSQVGTDHVFLALLKGNDDVATTLLHKSNLNFESARGKVLSDLRTSFSSVQSDEQARGIATNPELRRKFDELRERDSRYPERAYVVVQDAIKCAQADHPPTDDSPRHVSARQILEALLLIAKQEWGNGARECLSSLGIKTSDDVGEIIYNLVDIGAMATTEEDSRADFTGAFDFEQELRPSSNSTIWVYAWGIALIVSVALVLIFGMRDLLHMIGH